MGKFSEAKKKLKELELKLTLMQKGQHFVEILEHVNEDLAEKADKLIVAGCTGDWAKEARAIADEVSKKDPGLAKALLAWIEEVETLKCDGG